MHATTNAATGRGNMGLAAAALIAVLGATPWGTT